MHGPNFIHDKRISYRNMVSVSWATFWKRFNVSKCLCLYVYRCDVSNKMGASIQNRVSLWKHINATKVTYFNNQDDLTERIFPRLSRQRDDTYKVLVIHSFFSRLAS